MINVGFPLEVDDYVHRIGRTGRMGLSGEAVTVVNDALLSKASRSVVHGILSIVNASTGSLDHIPDSVIQFAGWGDSNRVPGDLDSSAKRFSKTSRKPQFSSFYSDRRQNTYRKSYSNSPDDVSRRYR